MRNPCIANDFFLNFFFICPRKKRKTPQDLIYSGIKNKFLKALVFREENQ